MRSPGFPESTRPNDSQSLVHLSLIAGHRDPPLKPNVTQINLGLPPLKACLSIRATHNCPHICLQNALLGGRGQSPEGHGDVTSAGWAPLTQPHSNLPHLLSSFHKPLFSGPLLLVSEQGMGLTRLELEGEDGDQGCQNPQLKGLSFSLTGVENRIAGESPDWAPWPWNERRWGGVGSIRTVWLHDLGQITCSLQVSGSTL